jgi:WD40 repeat protein
MRNLVRVVFSLLIAHHLSLIALAEELPAGARARLGSARWRHARPVNDLAYSADGRRLAAGDDSGLVRVWDPADGRPLTTFRTQAIAWTVAQSPDGQLLAAGGGPDNSVYVWDVTAGRELHRLTGHRRFVRAVAFAPDNRTLATAGFDRDVRTWDARTGRLRWRGEGHTDDVNVLRFSPDGRTLASAGEDGTVRLWDPVTGRELRTITGHTRRVQALAFAPDGRSVASGGRDRIIRVWEVATGRELRQLEGHAGEVMALAFAPDGRLASAAADNAVRFWDAAGRPERTVPTHEPVLALAFAPSGRQLALAGESGLIRFWGPTGPRAEDAETVPGGVAALAWSPDGRRLAAGGSDGSLRVWAVGAAGGGGRPGVLRDPTGPVTAVAWSPDGRWLVDAGGGGDVFARNAATGLIEGTLAQPTRDGMALAVSPDGRFFATLARDGSAVRLWHAEKRQPAGEVEAETAGALCFLPSGRLAVGSEDGTVTFYELPGLIGVDDLDGPEGVRSLACAADGSLLAARGADGSLQLWDLPHRRLLATHRDPDDAREFPAGGLAVSPDGRFVAASGGGDRRADLVRVWEAASGREVRRLRHTGGAATALAFSPDGRSLAAGDGDSTVLLWDLTPAGWLAGADAKPPTDPEALWAELAAPDAARAAVAAAALASDPGVGLACLRRHLRPAAGTDPDRFRGLVKNLDADAFAARQEAVRELAKLGAEVGPALEQVLAADPPPEVRRRVQALLEAPAERARTPDVLRRLRAVWALEMMGTAEARQVLGGLTRDDAPTLLAHEARAALERLAKGNR